MKKIILASIVFSIIASCGKPILSKEEAVKYSEMLVAENDKVVDAYSKLNDQIGTNDPNNIKRELGAYMTQINNSLIAISKVADSNDSTYKVAMREELQCYKSVGEKEVIKIIELYSIPDSLFTDELSDIAGIQLDSMTIKTSSTQDKMMKAFEEFQRKYVDNRK